jgi:hypothetical protein
MLFDANVIVWFVIGCFVIYLLTIIYFRWAYGFWASMPVQHTYDLFTYLAYMVPIQPYQIQSVDRILGQTNHINLHVRTLKYNELTQPEKLTVVDLIKQYYLPALSVMSDLEVGDMDTMYLGTMNPSFVSIYSDPSSSPSGVANASLMARPFTITQGPITLPAYFLEYQANSTKSREVTYSLIRSHLRTQVLRNPAIPQSFFKQEGTPIDGLVPFFSHRTYVASISNPLPPIKLQMGYSIIRIWKGDVNRLREVAEQLPKLFQFSIIPENFERMVLSGLIVVSCLLSEGQPVAYYFFKNGLVNIATTTISEKDGTCWHLIGSYCSPSVFEDVFYRGFLFSLREIQKEVVNLQVFNMDAVAHNRALIGRFVVGIGGYNVVPNPKPVYYYMINYVMPIRFSTEQCIIIV